MNVPHWRSQIEPHATAWRVIIEHASGRGLVHGMVALDHLRGNYGPADVADLLAAMVSDGVVRPVKLDTAGGPHCFSVMTFRGVGPSAGGQPSRVWSRAEAHLWTYEIGEAPEEIRSR